MCTVQCRTFFLLIRQRCRCSESMERAVNFFFGLLGYLLFGFVLSMETTRYLYIHTDLWQPYKPAYLNGAALTAIWFVLALLFLQIGFLCKSKKMITTGFCGLTLTALRMFFLDFISRIDTSAIPLDDPFCYGLIAESVILLLLGIQAYFDKENHDVLGAFSIFGMFLLLGILSVEWLLCVDIRLEPLLKRITPIHVPVRSLSVLWTVYAL
ncbi:MAG: hypothetical protein LBH00_10640, partial [Planctomycetaceae bacterium]|nr:hypothetical protein [Planctomycetaceae bacterium]